MSRPRQASKAVLTLLMQSQGVTTAQALADGLGVERSTVSRALTLLGDQVARLGAARQARYAMRRSVRQQGNRWPLYRIDEAGRAHEQGLLQALHGGFFIEAADEAPAWFRHGYAGGIFPGLPFFLNDARPQGFMGRAAARLVGPALGVPADPRDWQDDDVLVYLLVQGDEMPGDWVLGERMLEQALHQQTAGNEGTIIGENQRSERYPAMADEAMQRGQAGSSAGGEQPKFTASVNEPGGGIRHVLVKFSPPLDTPAGRRWADLLAAEWHALRLLSARGHNSARVELVEGGGRRFLEATRFDRVGAHGRRGVLTLQAVEAGLLDETAADWPAIARSMESAGLLSSADGAVLRQRWCFGQLIGNTDMHLGNASVWFGDAEPFRLAPAYDMLPMVWAPGAQGEIVPRTFAPPPPIPAIWEAWSTVMPWAQEFWQNVQADAQISVEFRALAAGAGAAVTQAAQTFAHAGS
jgi:hypothetical protein